MRDARNVLGGLLHGCSHARVLRHIALGDLQYPARRTPGYPRQAFAAR